MVAGAEAANRRAAGGYETPPETLLYLKHVENARREMDGLEPLPLTPEEERLELEGDRRFLEELPALRSEPGWQNEEARALIDHWERDVRGRLDEAARTGEATDRRSE